MNSPATIVMNAVRDNNGSGNNLAFFSGVEEITLSGKAPPHFTRNIFDVLKEFAGVIGRSVRSATIEVGNKSILIDLAARKRIESVFGSDTSLEGTLDGMLEAVNLHGKQNTFGHYPVVGANRVSCKFDEELLSQIRPALGKYVAIKGELKYWWKEKFPYEAFVTKIEVLDDWDKQPSFLEILGMDPEATGGLPSEEFTRKERHASQLADCLRRHMCVHLDAHRRAAER
jgi:hypothetical protein